MIVSLPLLFEIAGWAGTVTLLGAYFLMSLGYLRAESASYGLINIVGSFFIGANALYHGALPSTLLNVCWIIISLVLIWRHRKITPIAP